MRVLLKEPGADRILAILQVSEGLKISAGNYLELFVVVDRKRDPELSAELDLLIEAAQIEIVPFNRRMAQVARLAFRTYGKGMHSQARLNFGDCFAYALAKETGEPLLYVGNDFSHTDVIPALDPPIEV